MTGGHILTEGGDFLCAENGARLVTEDFVADPALLFGGDPRRSFQWRRQREAKKPVYVPPKEAPLPEVKSPWPSAMEERRPDPAPRPSFAATQLVRPAVVESDDDEAIIMLLAA